MYLYFALSEGKCCNLQGTCYCSMFNVHALAVVVLDSGTMQKYFGLLLGTGLNGMRYTIRLRILRCEYVKSERV